MRMGWAAAATGAAATTAVAFGGVLVGMPGNASGHYHLGWAELLLGNSERALLEFNEAAARLPIGATIVPRALALFSARQHDELELLLATSAEHATIQNGPALHELRRMQAAHALLRGEQELAADIMLADLAWLLERPHLLRERAGELAEVGEVLVRLGRGRDLLPMLRSMKRRSRAIICVNRNMTGVDWRLGAG